MFLISITVECLKSLGIVLALYKEKCGLLLVLRKTGSSGNRRKGNVHMDLRHVFPFLCFLLLKNKNIFGFRFAHRWVVGIENNN